MKRGIVVILLLMFLVSFANATNYYVKNGGNDNADGLSDATAWATLSKVNSLTFQPGDSILLKAGSFGFVQSRWKFMRAC